MQFLQIINQKELRIKLRTLAIISYTYKFLIKMLLF